MRDPELDLLIADLQAVGFNPGMTAEQAAKATFAVVQKAAKRAGQDPTIETFLRKPGEPRHFGDERCWVVAWEAGPYEWAVAASLCRVYPRCAEPYYSFDLTFYPGEWEGQR